MIAELEWNPRVNSSDISVAVKEGVVTLAGSVHSYAENLNVERGVKRLIGVRGRADELEVSLAGSRVHDDAAAIAGRTSSPTLASCASMEKYIASQ